MSRPFFISVFYLFKAEKDEDKLIILYKTDKTLI